MKIIKNNKITLKPFEITYLEDFVEAVRESEKTVGMWMPWCSKTYSEAEAHQWFTDCKNNIINKSAYDIGIFLANSDRCVGGVSINQINHQNKIGNIGYWVRESYQNQGIASSAVELIKNFGFNSLGLSRLEIVILEDNVISRKVAEKLDAQLECVAANRLVHDGKPMAAAVYSLVPL